MRFIDLNDDSARQIVVDKEEGQYLGHVSSVLLEDGKTIVAVYPKGHGRGPVILKKSFDGGLTWTDRLPLPESFKTSLERNPQVTPIVVVPAAFPVCMSTSESPI